MPYRIIEKQPLNAATIKLTVEAPLVASAVRAGQFVIIRPLENSERIPLTVCESDGKKGTIGIIFQTVGETTAELASLNQNEFICDVCGPLGNPTDVSGVKNAVVIGGGVGCAIALPVAAAFAAVGAKTTAILGFRNSDLVILKEEFERVCDRVVLVTDDGSAGEKGFVTTALSRLLETEKPDEVMAVGPIVMMRAVSNLTRPYGIKTVVSMNPIMIDGTGMCGGCRVKVDGKNLFACVDGPDFDGHLVDFEALISANSRYADFERKRKDNCRLFKKEG